LVEMIPSTIDPYWFIIGKCEPKIVPFPGRDCFAVLKRGHFDTLPKPSWFVPSPITVQIQIWSVWPPVAVSVSVPVAVVERPKVISILLATLMVAVIALILTPPIRVSTLEPDQHIDGYIGCKRLTPLVNSWDMVKVRQGKPVKKEVNGCREEGR
jgi:hypothetical protein